MQFLIYGLNTGSSFQVQGNDLKCTLVIYICTYLFVCMFFLGGGVVPESALVLGSGSHVCVFRQQGL